MMKLGITGNIASGKTLVETFLKEEGILTIDSDEIVHDLLENDKDTIDKVIRLFYPLNIFENNKISRKKVSKIVFKDKTMLKELEQILHPKVISIIQEFFDKNKDKKIAAAVVPLLYEAKMEKIFDFVILVDIDKEIQLKRLMQRGNFTEEEALNRINCQTSSEEKSKLADFIINNNLEPENTHRQLKDVLKKLFN